MVSRHERQNEREQRGEGDGQAKITLQLNVISIVRVEASGIEMTIVALDDWDIIGGGHAEVALCIARRIAHLACTLVFRRHCGVGMRPSELRLKMGAGVHGITEWLGNWRIVGIAHGWWARTVSRSAQRFSGVQFG